MVMLNFHGADQARAHMGSKPENYVVAAICNLILLP